MTQHPLAGLDKAHWGSWLQLLDRFTLFDLIKTLSLCSVPNTNTHIQRHTHKYTCMMHNLCEGYMDYINGQNICLKYANEEVPHSQESNVLRAMQRLIPFRARAPTCTCSNLAEWHFERQPGPAIWNSIVWGNVDSMDDSAKQTSGCVGGGIGVLTLKRSESNSCYAKAPKRFLYGEVETQRRGGRRWGEALPIAVLQNSEAKLHVATVLGGYCTLKRAFLGLGKYEYDPFSHVWSSLCTRMHMQEVQLAAEAAYGQTQTASPPHFMSVANTQHLHFLVFLMNRILLFAGIRGRIWWMCNIFLDERKNSGEWKL